MQSLDWQCLGFFRFQIDNANRVIVRIGNVQFIAGDSETSWFIKRRQGAVSLPWLSASRKCIDAASLRIEQLDLVIVRVGDQ